MNRWDPLPRAVGPPEISPPVSTAGPHRPTPTPRFHHPSIFLLFVFFACCSRSPPHRPANGPERNTGDSSCPYGTERRLEVLCGEPGLERPGCPRPGPRPKAPSYLCAANARILRAPRSSSRAARISTKALAQALSPSLRRGACPGAPGSLGLRAQPALFLFLRFCVSQFLRFPAPRSLPHSTASSPTRRMSVSTCRASVFRPFCPACPQHACGFDQRATGCPCPGSSRQTRSNSSHP